MKSLHRPDLFGWSRFDEARNLDFHGLAWIRDHGNVLVDPLPLSPHDEAHLRSLGGAAWIIVTNSDHVRAAADVADRFHARVAGPAAEKGSFPIRCDRWLEDGDPLVDDLQVLALRGSKTPGELALVIDQTTLVCGDLVRGPRGGALSMLPEQKLSDPGLALESVARLAALPKIRAVLVGDGWHAFRDGRTLLRELLHGQ